MNTAIGGGTILRDRLQLTKEPEMLDAVSGPEEERKSIIEVNFLDFIGKAPIECIAEQRSKLPFFKDPKIKLSIWTIIKDSIGKDLSQFSVPVFFNTPISLL